MDGRLRVSADTSETQLDLTPRDDQILGGALMGVGGTFITLGLIANAFFRWNRQSAPDGAAPSPP